MEIFILYKFYISFIFKTYFKKKKKKLCPKPELRSTPARGSVCASGRAQTAGCEDSLPSARQSARARCASRTVSDENPARSNSTLTQRRSVQKSASFIDYQRICASVSNPVRAHRAADRRLSCDSTSMLPLLHTAAV